MVLGAWGCGNFGNDPELVAKLFHQVLMEANPIPGTGIVDYFEEIAMAVFDNSAEQRCYQPFARYFPEGRSEDPCKSERKPQLF